MRNPSRKFLITIFAISTLILATLACSKSKKKGMEFIQMTAYDPNVCEQGNHTAANLKDIRWSARVGNNPFLSAMSLVFGSNDTMTISVTCKNGTVVEAKSRYDLRGSYIHILEKDETEIGECSVGVDPDTMHFGIYGSRLVVCDAEDGNTTLDLR